MNKTTKIIFALVAGLVLLIIVGAVVGFSMMGRLVEDQNTSSSETTPTDSPKTVGMNACELLTASEVSKVVGQTVKVNPSASVGDGTPDVGFATANSACEFASSDNDTRVEVRISTPGNGEGQTDYVKKEYARNKELAQNNKFAEDVSGVGDEAYWDSSAGALYVLKDNNQYMFALRGASGVGDKAKSRAESLARAAENKL